MVPYLCVYFAISYSIYIFYNVLQFIFNFIIIGIMFYTNRKDRQYYIKNVIHIFCFRFKYKDEYEKFKLILSAIAFVLAVLNIYIDFR